MITNSSKVTRREKLLVAVLANIIWCHTTNAPVEWVKPPMPGQPVSPKQELYRAIEAVKFEARAKESDTNRGGSPEWEADLRWGEKSMRTLWALAPSHTTTLYEALGTLAALALDLCDRTMLPQAEEIEHMRKHLGEVKTLFAGAGVSSGYINAIETEVQRFGLLMKEEV